MEQVKAVWGMVVSPRATLRSLPSNKLFLVSFALASYFGFARAFRSGGFRYFSERLGEVGASVLILLIGAFGFLIGSAILKIIVMIFGKRLSLLKIMNIIGYAQAPRLLLAAPASIIFAILPSEMKARFFVGGVTSLLIAIMVIGVLMVLYTLFLMIWGFIVSQDERNKVSPSTISPHQDDRSNNIRPSSGTLSENP